ncbi:MAG: proline racemase family protein [Cyclobacteriaceae bacterium]|nr:proline racemase family protein [Cyclobacteriaceae bacterium]
MSYPAYKKFLSKNSLRSGENMVQTIDMHTGGEPLRVIVSGMPPLTGENVLQNRRQMIEQYDHFRKMLMWEPRGHADMYGCILLPPNDEGADLGVIFMHNEGFSTMCGHAVIALARLAVEMEWVEKTLPETKVTLDAPCGRIYASALYEKEKYVGSSFECVPSFVLEIDQTIEVAGLGQVTYDLAYGGAFYAYVDSDDLGLSLEANNHKNIIETGRKIKNAIIASEKKINHPFFNDLSFLYGTIFISKKEKSNGDIHSKNVCIFADGELDRSPTGSGVAGRMALLYSKGEVSVGDKVMIESITGSVFGGEVIRTEKYGEVNAVIPRVEGTAYITGNHTFILEKDDPYQEGFLL